MGRGRGPYLPVRQHSVVLVSVRGGGVEGGEGEGEGREGRGRGEGRGGQ